MGIEETIRHIAEFEARERALREWATASKDTPLGRVAVKLIVEDDAAADLTGDHSPDYYSGLGFALGAVADEVLREREPSDPRATELAALAADLLSLYEAGALSGIRAIVAERLRQVRGDHARRVDGRAYQAAALAAEIDREETA